MIPYEKIVNIASIGKPENPILMNELLDAANSAGLTPASKNPRQVMVLAIDVQQDFMDDGALGVPGAHGDVERFTRFIYDNMEKISNITASIDTHNPFQIFHPCWWVDANGNHPAPYTLISLKDLDDGKWMAVINPIKSREYVENLEKHGKKVLCIWPYHCLQGTFGCALENQFANMMYFHSVAKKSIAGRMVKGIEPNSEMYGIIKPEYDFGRGIINVDFLNKLQTYDTIVVGGEAASHCVLESLLQIVEYFHDKPEITSKIVVLSDCMSSIPGFEQQTHDMLSDMKSKYKITIDTTVDYKL